MTWEQSKQEAKRDGTLRMLAAAIRDANRSGKPDRLAYAAFNDRCEEMGLNVPKGYASTLLGVVLFALFWKE